MISRRRFATDAPLTSAVVLGALTCSPTALAQGTSTENVSARLIWERAPDATSCIDRRALEEAVNRRWRRQVFVEGAADLVVEGRVGRGEHDRWSASVEMRRADGTSLGTRELVTRASDCGALNDSVALALGIMLDVSRKRIAEERATRREGVREAPGDELVQGAPIAVPEPARAPWHLESFAALEGFAGILPHFDAGGRFGVAAVPPERFRLEVSASVYAVDDVSPARPGARFRAWAAELGGYPVDFTGGQFRADLGVGVRVIAVHAAGVGLDQNAAADTVVPAVGPRVLASFWPLPALGVIAGLGGDISMTRYRFVYRATGGAAVSVFETGLFSAQMFVGVVLRL
ncbi:MAG TPA: hypothetical protein VHU80_20015 [Polyangiaceae bacterium]|nr:hypothetical protein [Polyangiaceae bacterium]